MASRSTVDKIECVLQLRMFGKAFQIGLDLSACPKNVFSKLTF